MAKVGLSGGDALTQHLAGLARKLGVGGSVEVGFLEDSTMLDGQPLPPIALALEFGARIEREPQEAVTIYRKLDADGGLMYNGKFVKKSKSNYATDHYKGAYVINIPPRPYFRNMIAKESPEWGKRVGRELKAADYDVTKALTAMGMLIQRQLRTSIRTTMDPPNAASTIRKKGFDNPLVQTGNMQRRVDYRVSTGAADAEADEPAGST